MQRDVIMPALGMTQDTGKITSWLKSAGDAVATGDALFEVFRERIWFPIVLENAGN